MGTALTYIEIVEAPNQGQPFHWRLKKAGRITVSAETFPTKSNAVRAAKAVVSGILAIAGWTPRFLEEKLPKQPPTDGPHVVARYSIA